MTSKNEFLLEHNRLASGSLQATNALLDQFIADKPKLVKNNDWPIDKIRRPFICWLTMLTEDQKKKINEELKK